MLTLCDAGNQEPAAALALARWNELQRVGDNEKRERRFRRRAFERARDRALQALAMRVKPWMLTRKPPASADSAHARPGDRGRVRRPAGRTRRLAPGARA